MNLTPQQQKKLQKFAKLIDNGNVAILEYLMELDDKIEAELPNIKDIISRVKGEKGDTPTRDELLALIEPLIPHIEQPLDGQDYVLTDYDKKEIAQLVKVPIVEKVIEKTTEIVREPVITRTTTETKVENPYILTGEAVVDSINELPLDPDLQIDAKHIKNLPKAVNNIMAGGTNGILEIVAGTNITVDKSNPKYPVVSSTGGSGGVTSIIAGTNITIDPVSGLGDVTINATGGGSQTPWTSDIDADGYTLTDVGTMDLDTAYTITGSEPTGSTYWDSVNHTTSTVLENGVILQNGQEIHVYGKNVSGSPIANGTPVSIVSNNGQFTAFGTVDITTPAAYAFIGIATQDFGINDFGYVTKVGVVRDIDTTNFDEGKPVYVAPDGSLTKTFPTTPNYIINVGIVEYKHANHGRINVIPLIVPRLNDLSDVDGTPMTTTGQFLVWNQTAQSYDANYNITNYQTAITWYQDELVSGTKDGNNVTFTLAHTPTGLVQLYLNGQYQVSGIDYTRTGTTITMTTAPYAGNILSCNYY